MKYFKDFKLYEAEQEQEVEFKLDDDETPNTTSTTTEETKPEEKTVEAEPETEEKSDETNKDSSDKFEKLKADISKMIDDSGNKADILKRAKDESVEALNIKGFNQDSDVYDFYLAHQFEIDEKLNEENFFDNKMSELGISGLYNAVIIGTQLAVKKVLEGMS